MKICKIATLIILLIVGTNFSRAEEPSYDDLLLKNISLFSEVLARIQQEHIDHPDAEKLINGAIKGMLRDLDPYSQFFDRKSYTDFRTESQGTYGGLGMEISTRKNRLTVVSPFKGTPADRVGLRSGDHVSQIDNESTAGMTTYDAAQKMRGEPGTIVTLTIIRDGENKPIDLEIVRDVIRIRSVEWKILNGKIGYIRINQFRDTTVADVDSAFVEFDQQKIRGIILDLRSNPGGLLRSAVEIASDFLDPGQLIVYTKGKQRRRDHVAEVGKKQGDYPLIVLVNGGSASASEVVAAAIKDHDRGIIMGGRTFGKASVQQIFPLSNGAAVKLTIAHYFSPNGVDIHKIGITPHIETAWFSRSESQLLNRIRGDEKIVEFIDENGDDILSKIEIARHASKDDLDAEKLIRKYVRLADALSENEINASNVALKYAIARETKNDDDDIIFDPQIAAAIQISNALWSDD